MVRWRRAWLDRSYGPADRAGERREDVPGRRNPARSGAAHDAIRTGKALAAAFAAAVIAGTALAGPSGAHEIQVFQESSPGRGDFKEHHLGSFEPLVAGKDAAQLYNYRGQKYRGGIELSRDRSHLFFAETTEGLVLFVIHDDGARGSRGGRAGLSIEVQGSSPAVLVKDDLGKDRYLVEGDRIIMQHRWIDGFTDGAVIGPFDGDAVIVDVKFFAENKRRPAIDGLESWAVLIFDPDQSSIDLVLEEELRARFIIVPGLKQPVKP